MAAVEILDIALPEVPHQAGTCAAGARRHEQVNMIRHQTVCVDRAIVLFRQLAQVGQVDEVIAVLLEARDAVISALNNV
jgi:hypothetical protein